jgi:hypothetical protein
MGNAETWPAACCADAPDLFASRILNLANTESLWLETQQAQWDFLDSHYGARVLSDQVSHLMSFLESESSAGLSLVGQMLWRDQVLSTRYRNKWQALKNA